jgi:hypothetical protein
VSLPPCPRPPPTATTATTTATTNAQQGFTQIKVLRVGRSVSCFVEFDRVEDAAACHSTQQVRACGGARRRTVCCGRLNSLQLLTAACCCLAACGAGRGAAQQRARRHQDPGAWRLRVLALGWRARMPRAAHSLTAPRARASLRTAQRCAPTQFSKNPFGKKRDANGQLVDARLSGGAAMGGAPPGMALAGYDGMPGGAAFDPSSAGTPVLPFDPAAAANAGLQ